MAKTQIIQVDTSSAVASMKELNKAYKEARDKALELAAAGKEGSREAILEAANLKHQITDLNNEIRNSAMDFGQVTSNITKGFAGVVGAIQSVNVVMGMLGGESEATEKAILALQRSMALIQGLQAAEEGIKAFKRLGTAIKNSELIAKIFGTTVKANTAAMTADAAATAGATAATNAFKSALISTGIGAIVVAVGALVANWDKLKNAISKSKDELHSFKIDWDAMDSEKEFRLKVMRLMGADDIAILEKQREFNQDDINALDTEIKRLEGRKRIGKKLSEEELQQLDDYHKKRQDLARDNIILDLQIQKANKDKADAEIANQEREAQAAADAAKAKVKANKDAAEAIKKANKDAYDGLVESYKSTTLKLQEAMAKELKLAENNESLRLKIIEKYSDKIYIAYEEEIKNVRQRAYLTDLRNLQNLYDKKEIESAQYYDELRKLDAKYMIDWGSYQSAAIARYNQQLIDIRKAFLNWSIDYKTYQVQITDATDNYYKELEEAATKHITNQENRLSELNKLYKFFTEDTVAVFDDPALLNEFTTEINKIYGEAWNNMDINQQTNAIKALIQSMTDAAGKELSAARTTIYQIQDYYIKAREAAQNWIDALDTLEKRKYNDRLERIQKQYDTELAQLKDLLDKKLILQEDYEKAYALIVSKRIEDEKQLNWDLFTEQANLADASARAISSIGSAIIANAEYQKEAGNISQAEYEKSLDQAQGYNIAGVVISTLAGIANATASIWSPNNAYLTVWGQVGMQAAITVEMLANMAAQIAQIKRQTLSSKGSGSISSSAAGSLIAPMQYTSTVQGASAMKGTKDTRVYVTEADISTTQNKVKVAQTESRF